MRDRNIGFLPVCDADGSLAGVVTDRDLTIRVLAEHRSPSTTRVAEVMTQELLTCSADDDLEHAQALMAHHQKSRIICVDVQGCPAGVISLSDLANIEDGTKAAGVLQSIVAREAPRGRSDGHQAKPSSDRYSMSL